MKIGFYPGWDTGFVLDHLERLRGDGQRKKAAAKLAYDFEMLGTTWPRPQLVTVKPLKGYAPLYELVREFQGIAYRVFFCVKGQEMWLLHSMEKKKQKTPADDLKVAYARMKSVLAGQVRSQ
jgi:phage-related protein